jgi:hypothetical protein
MRTHLPHPRTLLLSIFCLTLFIFSATAQQTKKISLQGFLKDANGKAVADGSQEITFKLYTIESGGTAAWTEVQTLNVFGGVYSTQLGKTTSLENLNWGSSTYYVGVTVQGTELTPRTELTFAPYSLGSPFAQKSQEVVCSGAVGDVKYSILNPTQFAAVNGSCWVAMDGRSIAGSKLATITGLSTVTNAGGLFLRGQEFSNSPNYDPNRDSNTTIATVQDQATQAHQHNFSGSTNYSDATGYSSFKYMYNIWQGNGGDPNRPSNTFSYESLEEGQGAPDRFPQYNTVDLRGSHSHSFSGSTGSNNGNAADETRPKNLNLWTYIRIN